MGGQWGGGKERVAVYEFVSASVCQDKSSV